MLSVSNMIIVCARAVSALILLLVVNLWLEIYLATSISYYDVENFAVRRRFRLFWRFFTAHAQLRPYCYFRFKTWRHIWHQRTRFPIKTPPFWTRDKHCFWWLNRYHGEDFSKCGRVKNYIINYRIIYRINYRITGFAQTDLLDRKNSWPAFLQLLTKRASRLTDQGWPQVRQGRGHTSELQGGSKN